MVALPVEFHIPDIKRYTGIGCPRIHLQLYNAIIRGHRLDEAQMIIVFPLSLSGAVQRWFASFDPSDVGHGLIWDKSLVDSILLIL